MKKLSTIGIIVSFLIMLVGIIEFFVYGVNNSIILILMSFAALISSFNMRTEKDQPIMRLAIGLFIVLALFSQAVLINNMYFAIIGLIAFIIFIVDYVKQSNRV